MRFLSALSLLATTSVYVLAQDTPTSTTTAATTQSTTSCDAQNILDACIQSIQIQVENCGPNEWDCLCEQTNNLLTCYNNCPLDPGRIGVQQQKVSYCNAAGITSTTTTTRASTTSTTATSTTEAGCWTGIWRWCFVGCAGWFGLISLGIFPSLKGGNMRADGPGLGVVTE
ncbi:hypothetical protein BJX70DRAFT_24769 [Aspergillus crustosus]